VAKGWQCQYGVTVAKRLAMSDGMALLWPGGWHCLAVTSLLTAVKEGKSCSPRLAGLYGAIPVILFLQVK